MDLISCSLLEVVRLKLKAHSLGLTLRPWRPWPSIQRSGFQK